MTFEEWWQDRSPACETYARWAWQAATKQEQERKCGTYGGTGEVDSGAPDPQGHFIDVRCPDCTQPIRRLKAQNEKAAELLAEYMASPPNDIEIDTPRMQLQQQHCGHPAQAIRFSDEGTNYCGWCAEVARLREAVAGLRYFLNDELMDNCNCAGCEIARTALAALSAPADDDGLLSPCICDTDNFGPWLEQHDADVRRKFLDSLCEPDILMTWVEYEIDSLKGWHAICRDYEGTDEIAVKHFGEAAAIREADDG